MQLAFSVCVCVCLGVWVCGCHMPRTAHALSASAFFVVTAGALFTHGKSKDMTSINEAACLKWHVLRQLAGRAGAAGEAATAELWHCRTVCGCNDAGDAAKQRLVAVAKEKRARKAAYAREEAISPPAAAVFDLL